MSAFTKKSVNLYADRFTRQWIVQDQNQMFWAISPADANPWEQRRPFIATENTELEPVPGHYKRMLGVPS